jgi:beta-lactamase class A
MKRLIGKTVPLYVFLLASGLLILILFHLNDAAPQAHREIREATTLVERAATMQQFRQNEYELIKPLLLTESSSESESLRELKRALFFEINNLKSNGTVKEASVYIQNMNDGDWISVNGQTTYAPGSMIKIAAMITYLSMSEDDPSLLSKQYTFKGPVKGMPLQTFNGEPMEAGKKYDARELLSRMIISSDNYATQLINNALDIQRFKKLFTDLGIPEPDVLDPKFTIAIENVSKFLNVLYNSTYLNPENSEFALSLLTQSSFNIGIVGGVPAQIKVAHKFGEMKIDSEAQLHETAIVYEGNDPYLITIMTKGNSIKELPGALSGLSKIAYGKMKKSS